jgi:hypothetical protein
VEAALAKLLAQGEVPEYDAVKPLATVPEVIAWPSLSIAEPDLRSYDALLVDTREVPA